MKVEVKDLMTCDMVIDNDDTIKNKLVEDKLTPVFEDKALIETDAKFTSKKPAMKQCFYPFTLYQCKTWSLTNAICISAEQEWQCPMKE